MENAVGEAGGGPVVLKKVIDNRGAIHFFKLKGGNGLVNVEGNGFDAGFGALRIGCFAGAFDLFGKVAFAAALHNRFVAVLTKVGGNESLVQLILQAHDGQRHGFHQQQCQCIKYRDIPEEAIHLRKQK